MQAFEIAHVGASSGALVQEAQVFLEEAQILPLGSLKRQDLRLG